MKEMTAGSMDCCPFGYTYDDTLGIFYFCAESSCDALSLNLYADGVPAERFLFPEECRQGDVFRMGLFLPLGAARYSYTYSADGKEFADPYGRELLWRRRWKDAGISHVPRTVLTETGIKPGEEEPPEHTDAEETGPHMIPCGESAVYRLHVRGFTKDSSSGLPQEKRGTFDGVIEKIPYLKELGITDVELFPVYEYDELEKDGRINYWGFTPRAQRFSVKAAFGGAEGFARLCKALHKNGMNLIVDLYFDGTEELSYISDVIRTWVFRYHADGVHLVGTVNIEELLKNPYMRGFKLWYDRIPQQGEYEGPAKERQTAEYRRRSGFAEYNTGFQNIMRRFLKGDGSMAYAAAACMHEGQPGGTAKISYMANADGFTLWDMLSYNQKHNDANGEFGRDGTEENLSWNCGEEGPSRRKKVLALRRRQWKNAVLLTVLSGGVPLILAGDEMLHTKSGNNNSWCQDNRTEWLDWKRAQKNADCTEFLRKALRLRREHPVFGGAGKEAPDGYGVRDRESLPAVSLHGENAWKFEEYADAGRVGLLLFGGAVKREDGSPDDSFYIGCNMHWKPHDFALPGLPDGSRWRLLVSTEGDFCETAEPLTEQKAIRIPERTIVVLTGSRAETRAGIQEEKKGKKTGGIPADIKQQRRVKRGDER
ncbi:MAG: alpha-amylase family glycosyl hydrolase [Eubacteriales bacterium]|nr:alpha-amylase family glycosyl hydrolase [Eubacteriales bacterium]